MAPRANSSCSEDVETSFQLLTETVSRAGHLPATGGGWMEVS